MKKRILALLAGAMLMTVMVSAANALPNLQVYSPGAVAGSLPPDQDTWYASTNPFNITVVGAMSNNEISLTDTYLLFSVVNGQTGTIKVDGNVVAPIYTTIANFAAAAGVVNFNFNNHYPLQDSVSDFLIYNIGSFNRTQVSSSYVLHDYDAATGIITPINSGNTYGQERDFSIIFDGYDKVHVDAFGIVTTQNGRRLVDSWTMNPGSHDTTSTPVPEPGTMMLLGFGMLGLAVFGKRRMNKND